MQTLEQMLSKAVELGAADMFIIPGAAPTCRADGQLVALDETPVRPELAEVLKL